MLYASCYNNEIRLWWDERNDKEKSMKYRVYVDGGSCVYTNKIYYNFKNLESGKEYEFELQVVDKQKNIVGKTEKIKFSTLCARRVVDVSKPPYNIVGNASTDNKQAINELIKNNNRKTTIKFPMGVYICESINFSGDIEIMLEVGAVICSKEKGVNL